MNKDHRFITIMLFALAVCMLLTACAYDAVNGENESQNPHDTSDTVQTTQDPETTGLLETEPQDTTEEPQDTTEKVQQPDEFEASGLSKYLIIELTDCLENYLVEVNPAELSFAMTLSVIKQYGRQSLHVKFDANDYYYACAYYNPADEHSESSGPYCCVHEYTWVKFESAEQITQTYQELGLVAAFQINKALFCHAIGAEGGLSEKMEHYQQYTPAFLDGVNVAEPIVFDRSYVYLNGSTLETVYFTAEKEPYGWIGFDCVDVRGKLYVPLELYTVNSDGTRYNHDLENEFDTYYDDVMSVMVMDQYSVCDERGNTTYYGLLSVEDISSIIRQ